MKFEARLEINGKPTPFAKEVKAGKRISLGADAAGGVATSRSVTVTEGGANLNTTIVTLVGRFPAMEHSISTPDEFDALNIRKGGRVAAVSYRVKPTPLQAVKT